MGEAEVVVVDPPKRGVTWRESSPSEPEFRTNDPRNPNGEVDHHEDWARMVESLLAMPEPAERFDDGISIKPRRERTKTFGDPEDPWEMMTNEVPPKKVSRGLQSDPSVDDNPRISEPLRTTATLPTRSPDEKWAAMVESVLACMEDDTFHAPISREKSDRRVGSAEPEGSRQIPQNKALKARDMHHVSEPSSSRALPQSRAKDWERYVDALLRP